jgi:hypothetical protein
MLIKLPIIEDNRIILGLFKLYKIDNIIYLSLLQNNKSKPIKINIDISEDSELLKLSVTNSDNNLSDNKEEIKDKETINLIKIICCNDVNGLNYLNLYTPLKFYIIDNKLVWNLHFIQTSFLCNYKNKNIDFLYLLDKYLINNFNLEILKIDNLKKNESIIWKYINNEFIDINNNKKFDELEEFNKNFLDNINLL